MGRKRATFDVEKLRQHVNSMLAESVDEVREGRIALAIVLEHVLMETGNYRGYGYVPSAYLPADQQSPGHVLRDGHDETRRQYY